jgi:hypothetical protein
LASIDKDFKVKNGLIVGDSTNLVNYSSASPLNPFVGQIWVDPTASAVSPVDLNDYLTKSSASATYANKTDFSSTAWTAYTPTITADGGGFSLNNGTLTGRYKQLGKTVFFSLKFVFGSTTSTGTGHWNFSLPVTAYDANFTFTATILDDGIAWYGGIGNGNYTGSTTSFAVIIPGTNSSVTTWASVGNGGPFIWGTSDNITISGSYEAA